MKTVWIFNHFAAPPSIGQLTRHYNFAKQLIKVGYNVKVFASSAVHNTDHNYISNGDLFVEMNENGVPFVFIKTRQYKGNRVARIINILEYYLRIFKVVKKFDRPDIIFASSFHLLACIAGIKIAKKMKIPCVCEIRDLWPETLVAYSGLKRSNPIVKILYSLEKRIYEKSDALIFTIEGGAEYVKERSINISEENIYHINNGIELENFLQDKNNFVFDDLDLSNNDYFNIVYAGSIRLSNSVNELIYVAERLQAKNLSIKLLIWGKGDYVEKLKSEIVDKNLTNIIYKGGVEKKYIPSILAQSDATLLHYRNSYLLNYGVSFNKMFDYLASGKPVISTVQTNYDIIEKNGAGVVSASSEIEDIVDAIVRVSTLEKDEYSKYCENAIKLAAEYDFENLTDKLINIIETVAER